MLSPAERRLPRRISNNHPMEGGNTCHIGLAPSGEIPAGKTSWPTQGEVSVVANARGGGRGLAAVLTAVAVIGFIVFVAIVIESYDTDTDVQSTRAVTPSGQTSAAPAPATPSAAPAPATPPAAPAPATPPVGGVATGGGGTAPDNVSAALPVVGGLAALTLLAAAGVVWRQRAA